jgi:hypothetical protein
MNKSGRDRRNGAHPPTRKSRFSLPDAWAERADYKRCSPSGSSKVLVPLPGSGLKVGVIENK